jgi:hypothetical protein
LQKIPKGIYFTSYFFVLRICLCNLRKHSDAHYRSRDISGRRNVQSLSNQRPTMAVEIHAVFFKPQVLRPVDSIPYFICVKPLCITYHPTFMLPLVHTLAYYKVIKAAFLFVCFYVLTCIWRFPSTSLKATFIKLKVPLHTPWKLTVQWRYTPTHPESQHVIQGALSASRPRLVTSEDRAFGTRRIGSWAGPRGDLDVWVKRKVSSPCSEPNQDFLVIQPATWSLYLSRYPGS